ncbi:UNVERIFIED_ORG: hypothetical protein GGR68_002266 [Xanthomonas campestris]
MSLSSPATVPPGKLTAEDLLGQLLALIKGSQTISDFTPERLNSAMGQVVQFVKDDKNADTVLLARSPKSGVTALVLMKPNSMGDGSNSLLTAMWPVHHLR